MPPDTGRSPLWNRLAKNRVVDEADERGRLQLFLPSGDACISRVTGHLNVKMTRRWMDVIDPYFARNVVFDTFHDWEEMTSYDSSARRALTTWVVANHRCVRSAHFLVGSKLVAMGVSAASLATALVGLPMTAHASRPPFEAELVKSLDRAR